jgi:hypothetical protein
LIPTHENQLMEVGNRQPAVAGLLLRRRVGEDAPPDRSRVRLRLPVPSAGVCSHVFAIAAASI